MCILDDFRRSPAKIHVSHIRTPHTDVCIVSIWIFYRFDYSTVSVNEALFLWQKTILYGFVGRKSTSDNEQEPNRGILLSLPKTWCIEFHNVLGNIMKVEIYILGFKEFRQKATVFCASWILLRRIIEKEYYIQPNLTDATAKPPTFDCCPF